MALISRRIAWSMPLCCPIANGPSGGIGTKPNAFPYLAMNRTSGMWLFTVSFDLAQKASRVALLHKLSKQASAMFI
jgi:hypothetical protein